MTVFGVVRCLMTIANLLMSLLTKIILESVAFGEVGQQEKVQCLVF